MKEEIIEIINTGLKVDGTTIKAKDVLTQVPNEMLISTLAYLLGYLDGLN